MSEEDETPELRDETDRLTPVLFHAARIKIQRARKHLTEFENLVTAHLAQHPPTVEVLRGAEALALNGTDLTVKVGAKRLPEASGAVIGDAIHNLRAALDVMAVELVRLRDGNTNNVYFPFCAEPSELEETIKRKNFHRAGPEAIALLKQIAPYHSGNHDLRALHDLDIQDKHQTLIPTMSQVTSPPLTAEMVDGDLAIHVGEVDTTGLFAAAFRSDGALAGRLVIETLHGLVRAVDDIVGAFATLVSERKA